MIVYVFLKAVEHRRGEKSQRNIIAALALGFHDRYRLKDFNEQRAFGFCLRFNITDCYTGLKSAS